LQALTNALRSERREIDPEWLFRQLQRQKLQAVLLSDRLPAVESGEIPQPPEAAAPDGGQKTIVEAGPAIDLLI
jgi:hypothetical protein